MSKFEEFWLSLDEVVQIDIHGGAHIWNAAIEAAAGAVMYGSKYDHVRKAIEELKETNE